MNQEIDLAEQKRQIRQYLKEQRASISPEDHAKFSKTITEKVLAHPKVQEAQTIFGFISWSTEVDTHDLMKTLLDQGKTILVPKIISPTIMEAQQLQSWSDLKEDKLGILAPQTSVEFNGDVDVVITPGLGFTEGGQRIGFGAGYYDRWFTSSSALESYKLAIAFEKQLIKSIPVERTDVPVKTIVTEEREITTQ